MELLLIIGLIVAGVYLYRRWQNSPMSEPAVEPRDVPAMGRGRRLPPTAYGPHGPDALSGQMRELSQQALDELHKHLDTTGNPQVDLTTADFLAAMRYYRIGVSPAMSNELIEAARCPSSGSRSAWRTTRPRRRALTATRR